MERFGKKMQAGRSEIEVVVFESSDAERIASALVIRSADSYTQISISAMEMRELALALVEAASHKEIEMHRRTAQASLEQSQ